MAKPIPLTEEWLVKFGFKIEGKTWGNTNYSKDFSGIWLQDRGELYKCTISNGNKHIEIRYVHQLQNLYFALTGEELNQNKEDE